MKVESGRYSSRFGEQLLSELSDYKRLDNSNLKSSDSSSASKTSFMDHLENAITRVNEDQKLADKASTDLATGKSQNIHETMLASSQAELSFKMLVQMRNKAIEAYQEIMRMPV